MTDNCPRLGLLPSPRRNAQVQYEGCHRPSETYADHVAFRVYVHSLRDFPCLLRSLQRAVLNCLSWALSLKLARATLTKGAVEAGHKGPDQAEDVARVGVPPARPGTWTAPRGSPASLSRASISAWCRALAFARNSAHTQRQKLRSSSATGDASRAHLHHLSRRPPLLASPLRPHCAVDGRHWRRCRASLFFASGGCPGRAPSAAAAEAAQVAARHCSWRLLAGLLWRAPWAAAACGGGGRRCRCRGLGSGQLSEGPGAAAACGGGRRGRLSSLAAAGGAGGGGAGALLAVPFGSGGRASAGPSCRALGRGGGGRRRSLLHAVAQRRRWCRLLRCPRQAAVAGGGGARFAGRRSWPSVCCCCAGLGWGCRSWAARTLRPPALTPARWQPSSRSCAGARPVWAAPPARPAWGASSSLRSLSPPGRRCFTLRLRVPDAPVQRLERVSCISPCMQQ